MSQFNITEVLFKREISRAINKWFKDAFDAKVDTRIDLINAYTTTKGTTNLELKMNLSMENFELLKMIRNAIFNIENNKEKEIKKLIEKEVNKELNRRIRR